jgi:hypothetical protein
LDLIFASFDAERPRELWDKHSGSLQGSATEIRGVALFRWLEGDAHWVGLYDVAPGTTDGAKAAVTNSLREDLRATVGDVTRYVELFSSTDARGVDECPFLIYMPTVDFSADPSTEVAFNLWYDTKHLPELAAAGLRGGRRFKANRAAWQYAALYDLESAAILESEALAKARGFGQFAPHVRGWKKCVLQRILISR